MKGADIKIGETYAIGHPGETQYAPIPGKVVAVGLIGEPRGKKDHTEIEPIDTENAPRRYRVILDSDGTPIWQGTFHRTQQPVGSQRIAYRVPHAHILKPWAKYVMQRDRQQQIKAHAKDEQQRQERQHDRIVQALEALGVEVHSRRGRSRGVFEIELEDAQKLIARLGGERVELEAEPERFQGLFEEAGS